MHTSSCKVPVIHVTFKGNLNFSGQIFEKYSNIRFMKIRPAGTELFHVDIRADGHDEVNSRFSKLCDRA
jgi:hypothetical protein